MDNVDNIGEIPAETSGKPRQAAVIDPTSLAVVILRVMEVWEKSWNEERSEYELSLNSAVQRVVKSESLSDALVFPINMLLQSAWDDSISWAWEQIDA